MLEGEGEEGVVCVYHWADTYPLIIQLFAMFTDGGYHHGDNARQTRYNL